MTCNICGKKKATVHLTEIVDEQLSEMHLCEECARQKSAAMENQFGLADLLAGLADQSKTTGSKISEAEKTALRCSRCGLPYEDFRKFGRLGCHECYASFKDHLSGLLRKIHGSNKYLGKLPIPMKGQEARETATAASPVLEGMEVLGDLRHQLQLAIEAEDFERAAMIRDKIRSLENHDAH